MTKFKNIYSLTLLIFHSLPFALSASEKIQDLKANVQENVTSSRFLQTSDFFCPVPGSEPISFSVSGILNIESVPIGTLCTLTLKKIENDEEILIPLGRSCDNHPWERVESPHPIDFTCVGSSCSSSILPDIDTNSSFQLTMFDLSNREVSSLDIAERFLEKATFGPTRSSLDPWRSMEDASHAELDDSFAEWVDEQINVVPLTSQREYFRKRSATVTPIVHMLGAPPHPCSAETRWRKYAFTTADANTISFVHFQPMKVRVEGASEAFKYHLSVNGKIRTEIINLH